jgi:hypothetical protein
MFDIIYPKQRLILSTIACSWLDEEPVMDTENTAFPIHQSAGNVDLNTASAISIYDVLPPQTLNGLANVWSWLRKNGHICVADDTINATASALFHNHTPNARYDPVAGSFTSPSSERIFHRLQLNGQLLRNPDASTSDSMLDMSGGIWAWPNSSILNVRATIAVPANIESRDVKLDDPVVIQQRQQDLRRVFGEGAMDVLQITWVRRGMAEGFTSTRLKSKTYRL